MYLKIKQANDQYSINKDPIKLNQLLGEAKRVKNGLKDKTDGTPKTSVEITFFDVEKSISSEEYIIQMRQNFEHIQTFTSETLKERINLKASSADSELIRLYSENQKLYFKIKEHDITLKLIDLLQQVQYRSLIVVVAGIIMLFFLFILATSYQNSVLTPGLKVLLSLYFLVLLQHFNKVDEHSVNINDSAFAFTHFSWYMPSFFSTSFTTYSTDERKYYINQSVEVKEIMKQQEWIINQLKETQTLLVLTQKKVDTLKIDYTIIRNSKQNIFLNDLEEIKNSMKTIDTIDKNTRRQ